MAKKQTQTDKTSAETKSIGFDYQYYFFLWKLLSLRTGESVGLEVKDDVHTKLNNDEQIFYQIKHTIKKKSDDTAVNLTKSDIDLWKTLSNWSKVISDKEDNRENKHEQLSFLKKTSFVLASNKSSSKDNGILKSISALQGGLITIADVKKVFLELSEESTSSSLIEYIEDVLLLDIDVLNEFVLKIYFELDEDDIIGKCKGEIKADKIDINKINDVFSSIDSAIRADNFINIKKGQKIEITFDDFYKKYRRHYDLARNSSLRINEFKGAQPNALESQTFIRQLIEIKDLESDDIEEIAEFTRFKLKLQNNIDRWIHDGDITETEVADFKNNAIIQWKNKHRSTFRGVSSESEFNDKGLKVLDSMRDGKLTIAGQELDFDISNGAFYELSDIPNIGWRKDWEKYKK